MRLTFPMTYSGTLLILALVGFGYNLSPATRAPDLFQPRFVVHGLACLGWLSLLVVQTSLVGAGRTRLHRRLGVSAIVVASAVVLSSVFVGIASLAAGGWLRLLTYGNVAAVIVFGVFIALAYRARRDREAHRRLMLVGTLFMMGPVYTRLGGIHPLAFLAAHIVGWIAILVWDRTVHGRIHRTAWVAVGLLFVYMVFTALAYEVRLGTQGGEVGADAQLPGLRVQARTVPKPSRSRLVFSSIPPTPEADVDEFREGALRFLDNAVAALLSSGQSFCFLPDGRDLVDVVKAETGMIGRFSDHADEGWPALEFPVPAAARFHQATVSVLTRSAVFFLDDDVEAVEELARVVGLPGERSGHVFRARPGPNTTYTAAGTARPGRDPVTLITVRQQREPEAIRTAFANRMARTDGASGSA